MVRTSVLGRSGWANRGSGLLSGVLGWIECRQSNLWLLDGRAAAHATVACGSRHASRHRAALTNPRKAVGSPSAPVAGS